jgi:hypothetical protein
MFGNLRNKSEFIKQKKTGPNMGSRSRYGRLGKKYRFPDILAASGQFQE